MPDPAVIAASEPPVLQEYAYGGVPPITLATAVPFSIPWQLSGVEVTPVRASSDGAFTSTGNDTLHPSAVLIVTV
jgi:hypothetical protein